MFEVFNIYSGEIYIVVRYRWVARVSCWYYGANSDFDLAADRLEAYLANLEY